MVGAELACEGVSRLSGFGDVAFGWACWGGEVKLKLAAAEWAWEVEEACGVEAEAVEAEVVSGAGPCANLNV